ncbi:MAG: methylmalonyl-CoA mutase family protein, partial [Miltoncostaeaceae bacterium]
AAAAARALGAVCAERGVDPLRAAGALGIDPIGDHAQSGGAAGSVADRLEEAAALARVVGSRNPHVRGIAVDVARYHAAGGTQTQALGLALATGVAYLRVLVRAGMSTRDAAAQIEFRVAAPPDQFPTIASLRALRTCWARVGEVVGLPAEARGARIHAVPATATLTRHDPWVNLLRGTVSCFAAAVGGADVVTVAPYDDLAPGGAGELGRRMARNTQALLADESGVGRVVDPAGGSHFVERLTAQMATSAWAWFQELEAAGGAVAAIETGLVAERLDERWEARRAAIAHRRDPITGVSEFPILEEDVPAPSGQAVAETGAPFPPLPVRRHAEQFEALRARAERHRAATGARPSVFLATLGTPADHIARATFAANLFAAGGIEALPGGDLAPGDDVGAAFVASGARLACICSTDALYSERAAAAASALRSAGAARVHLAGAPGADADALRDAGVDEFAHSGIDALALLDRALDAAGVAP